MDTISVAVVVVLILLILIHVHTTHMPTCCRSCSSEHLVATPPEPQAMALLFRPDRLVFDGERVKFDPVIMNRAPGIVYRGNAVASDSHFTVVMNSIDPSGTRTWAVSNITYLDYITGTLDVWNGNTLSEYVPVRNSVCTATLFYQRGLNMAKKYTGDINKFANDNDLYALTTVSFVVE